MARNQKCTNNVLGEHTLVQKKCLLPLLFITYLKVPVLQFIQCTLNATKPIVTEVKLPHSRSSHCHKIRWYWFNSEIETSWGQQRKKVFWLNGEAHILLCFAFYHVIHCPRANISAALLKVFAFILQTLAFAHRHHLGQCDGLCIFDLTVYLPNSASCSLVGVGVRKQLKGVFIDDLRY